MGAPMARNALKAGFPVTVTNRTLSRAEPLAKDGATVVKTPREVAERSDIVVTMVPNTPHVEAAVFGPDGVAADVQRAMPLFSALGKTIVHIGDHGAGQACKLANQIAVALNNLGVSEALVFAASQGIDLEKTRQVIAGGAGSSWAMQNYAPKMLAGDFRPGFMVDLQQKDLRLVLDNAFADHISLPGAALVHELYNALQKDGGGREGNLALIKVIERLAGIEARVRS